MYAFVEPPARVPDVRGLDDASLMVEHAADLDVVVSSHEALPLEASEAAVLAHARVVEALAQANDGVLPARFGGGHADQASLHAAVADRAAALQAALARVSGCVELGLRILGAPPEPTPAESGASYMHARLAERQRTERVADEVHAPLAALAREATRTVGATPRLLLSGAYLVPRADVESFRAAVERAAAEHPELSLVCTGPWPPYSFVTAGAS